MLALWGWARLGAAGLRLALGLLLIGSIFAAAVFIKNYGAIETQRDILVGANEDAREVVDDILAEIYDIRDLQAEQREKLAHAEADILDLQATIARLDEDWMHTPLRELVER